MTIALAAELSQDYLDVLGTGTRPVWLLDIDGVLRPDGAPAWPEAARTRTADGLRVTFAPSLIDWVRELVVTGAIDLVWSTTWCGRIDRMLEVFDLPGYDPDPARPRTVEAWNWYVNGEPAMLLKHAALQVALDSGRPVIHTDDHVACNVAGPDYLAIRPETASGLSQEHMLTIASFVASHQ